MLHMSRDNNSFSGKVDRVTKKGSLFYQRGDGRLIVKLYEIGVLSFGAKIPGILAMIGFQQFTLDILNYYFLLWFDWSLK